MSSDERWYTQLHVGRDDSQARHVAHTVGLRAFTNDIGPSQALRVPCPPSRTI